MRIPRLAQWLALAALVFLNAVPHATPAAASPIPAATVYVYCYSEPGGGLDFYYSDIFALDVNGHMTARGFVPDTLTMNKVLDSFSTYLKLKGYKFYHVGFELDTDQAQARALKHRRAYEGNPCSNCGKVVETGWKYTPGQ